jgi:hypothetical protein
VTCAKISGLPRRLRPLASIRVVSASLSFTRLARTAGGSAKKSPVPTVTVIANSSTCGLSETVPNIVRP